jgi:hypothetical protein
MKYKGREFSLFEFKISKQMTELLDQVDFLELLIISIIIVRKIFSLWCLSIYSV